jgi:WD40 repeat protein
MAYIHEKPGHETPRGLPDFEVACHRVRGKGVRRIMEFHPFRQILAIVIHARNVDAIILHDLSIQGIYTDQGEQAAYTGPWFPLGGLQHPQQVKVVCMAWNSLGHLAVGGEKGVVLWKLSLHPPGGKPKHTRPTPTLLEYPEGNFSNVTALSWSPDGRTLAVGCAHTDALFLWDTISHQPLKLVSGVGGPTLGCIFSPGAFIQTEFNPTNAPLASSSFSSSTFSQLQQSLLKNSTIEKSFDQEKQAIASSGRIPMSTKPGSGAFLLQSCAKGLSRIYETTRYTHRNVFMPTMSVACWIPEVSPPMLLFSSHDQPSNVQVWMMKNDGDYRWDSDQPPGTGYETIRGLETVNAIEYMAMDPTGRRLAIISSGKAILYSVKTRPLSVDFTLIGQIVGPGGKALQLAFAKQYAAGALLCILWDDHDLSRISFLPCHF